MGWMNGNDRSDMNWIEVDKKQYLGEIKERNLYRKLLEECLSAFNQLPRQKLANSSDTYKIAAKIDQAFRE